MSSKLLLVGSIAIAVIAIFLIAAFFIHTSAYFMWAALPEDAPIKLFVDMQGPLYANLAGFRERYHLDHFLPFPENTVVRASFANGEDAETAVILPRLTSQIALARNLQNQGWRTQRLGLLLLAHRGKASAQPPPPAKTLLRRGLSSAVSLIGYERLPLAPEILLSLAPGSGKFFTDPITVIGVSPGRAIVLHARRDGRLLQDMLPPFNPPSGLHAAFPGSFIAQLPSEVKNDWNEYLRREFNFTASRPDIAAGLSSLPRSEIHVTATASVLSAGSGEGNNFLELAEVWVREEIAHRNPVTAAFRLPDGTLGYEKRPAPVTTAFTEAPDSQGCQGSSLPNIFLCKSGNSAFMTTTADGVAASGNVSPPVPDANWYIVLDETLSRKVGLPGITSVVAWGRGESTTVVLPLLED